MTDLIIREITGYLLQYKDRAVIVGIAFVAIRLVVAFFKRYKDKRNIAGKQWLRLAVDVVVDFLAAFYVVMVVMITFFSRREGSTDVINMELFSTFRQDIRSKSFIIENILLFVPFGCLIRWYGIRRYRIAFLLLAGTSIVIECMQYLSGRGRMEVDDILTNTFGGSIGFVFAVLFFQVLHIVKGKRRKK